MLCLQETIRVTREQVELERQVTSLKKQLAKEAKFSAQQVNISPCCLLAKVKCLLLDNPSDMVLPQAQARESEEKWTRTAHERERRLEEALYLSRQHVSGVSSLVVYVPLFCRRLWSFPL